MFSKRVSRRTILMALLIAQVVIALLMVRNWAYVTTYRLYLDHRMGAAIRSIAAQQFDIEGERVVPQIVTHGPERVAFETEIGVLHHSRRPVLRPTTFAINWNDGPVQHVLARGTVDGAASIVCAFPTGTGVVELVGDDALTWVDPRIVRDQRAGRYAVALTLLILCSWAWKRRRGRHEAFDRATPARVWWFKVSAVAVSATLALLVSELALRAMGDSAPGGILTERHDLGEVTRDPRWEESPRYGRRLRPNVDTLNEWRNGDIVRMGYIHPR